MKPIRWIAVALVPVLLSGCIVSDVSNVVTFLSAVGAVDAIRQWLITLQG
jgi:hypothetical protein